MRFALHLLVAGIVCLTSTGCITALTAIKLRPDGSGTVEQTVSMKAEMAKQLTEMMQGMAADEGEGEGAAADSPELFSEEQMRDGAAKLGEGVTFVSSRPVEQPGFVGRTAIYSFTDITKLRVSQKPDTPGPAGGMEGSDEAEDVAFRFSRGPGTSTVTVVFPEPTPDEDDPDEDQDTPGEGEAAGPAEPDPAQIAMMKQLFDGLRIAIDLEVDGDIVRTNSPYAEGPRVTLLEMDFSELLENETLLGKVAKPQSIEEAKALLQNIRGFKVNLDREVVVEFR